MNYHWKIVCYQVSNQAVLVILVELIYASCQHKCQTFVCSTLFNKIELPLVTDPVFVYYTYRRLCKGRFTTMST